MVFGGVAEEGGGGPLDRPDVLGDLVVEARAAVDGDAEGGAAEVHGQVEFEVLVAVVDQAVGLVFEVGVQGEDLPDVDEHGGRVLADVQDSLAAGGGVQEEDQPPGVHDGLGGIEGADVVDFRGDRPGQDFGLLDGRVGGGLGGRGVVDPEVEVELHPRRLHHQVVGRQSGLRFELQEGQQVVLHLPLAVDVPAQEALWLAHSSSPVEP